MLKTSIRNLVQPGIQDDIVFRLAHHCGPTCIWPNPLQMSYILFIRVAHPTHNIWQTSKVVRMCLVRSKSDAQRGERCSRRVVSNDFPRDPNRVGLRATRTLFAFQRARACCTVLSRDRATRLCCPSSVHLFRVPFVASRSLRSTS